MVVVSNKKLHLLNALQCCIRLHLMNKNKTCICQIWVHFGKSSRPMANSTMWLLSRNYNLFSPLMILVHFFFDKYEIVHLMVNKSRQKLNVLFAYKRFVNPSFYVAINLAIEAINVDENGRKVKWLHSLCACDLFFLIISVPYSLSSPYLLFFLCLSCVFLPNKFM